MTHSHWMIEETHMFKFADQPRTIAGQLLDALFIYRQVIVKVLLFSFVLAVFTYIPDILQTLMHRAPPVVPASGAPRQGLSAMHFMIMYVDMVIGVLFFAAIMHRIHMLVLDSRAPLTATLSSMRTSFVRLVLTALLVSFVILLGMLALMLPGVFMGVLLLFYVPAILFDKMGVMDALRASAGLVWGRWWRTFATILLPVLASYMLSSIIVLSFGGLKAFEVSAWAALLNVLVITLITPYMTALIMVMYNDLKLRERAAVRIDDTQTLAEEQRDAEKPAGKTKKTTS